MSHFQNIENKILLHADLVPRVEEWKSNGESIVFTNGCFDLIHLGHITYLAQAADLGDRLIVGVNSDDSVRRLGKRPSRPLKDEDSRLHILAALAFVDAVVLFDDDTPEHLINSISPDVLVKGGDYDPLETNPNTSKYIVGSKEVKERGGDVVVIPFLPGYSTTGIEDKILKAGENG
jgi:rfaE bifunctional protein nucleotidyltransferase chain/domain